MLLVLSEQLYSNISVKIPLLFFFEVFGNSPAKAFFFLLHTIWDLKTGPMGMEGAVAVGYIGPLIWLDSVGSSFIHYIYKVKGYIYCLTGWKANERGCHRYIDYLFTIKPPGDLLIFFFIEISFGRIPMVLNISTGSVCSPYCTLRFWGFQHT